MVLSIPKVNPTTFWLKCINLSKCAKLCFTDKLEVADRCGGLKTIYQAIFGLYTENFKDLKTLNSNFACVSRCTHIIFLPVGSRKSLLIIIKSIWKLNLFLSSQKASTSNFHVFFLGSFVFNLRFEKFQNNRLFSCLAEHSVNIYRYRI